MFWSSSCYGGLSLDYTCFTEVIQKYYFATEEQFIKIQSFKICSVSLLPCADQSWEHPNLVAYIAHIYYNHPLTHARPLFAHLPSIWKNVITSQVTQKSNPIVDFLAL